MRPRWGVAALLLALPALLPAARAQLAPSPDEPPVSTAPAQPPEDMPVATLKLNVNLVDVVFIVRDKAGNVVPHLTKEECAISEDKAPQTLKSFAAEAHLPLTLGILLDTSGSQQRVLPLEQDVGSQFLERVLKPKDEAFLLSFDVDVDLLQDYTNNPRLLARAAMARQAFRAPAVEPFLPSEIQREPCSSMRWSWPRTRRWPRRRAARR